MIKLCRLLIVALLALAIPVQGAAAAGMLHCGSDHHPAGAAVHALAQGDASDPGAAEAAHHHDGHAGAGHEPLQADFAAADAASEAEVRDHSAPATCSACAACCHPAAMAASTPLFSPPGMAPLPASMPSILFLSFDTDGPRHPPRFLLA
jgi:hypothetical protein